MHDDVRVFNHYGSVNKSENEEFRFICGGFMKGLGWSLTDLSKVLGYRAPDGLWRALYEGGTSPERLARARTLQAVWSHLNARGESLARERRR